jgi:hypothetical protein
MLVTQHTDHEQLRTQLEAKQLGAIEVLGHADTSVSDHIRFDLHTCRGCEKLHALDVTGVVYEADRDGRKANDTLILSGLLLTDEEVATLREIDARFAGSAQMAALG